jgi:amidase
LLVRDGIIKESSVAKSFALEETTIDQVHDAYRAKTLTCVELVQGYLDRIAAYDQKGPALNAFVALNADALTEAAALDAAFQQSGKLSGPLHGIPIAVKDQAETKGIPTSFGSIAIKGYVPKEDSTLVAKLKAAGAVILGKTTLPDFATSWFGYSSAGAKPKIPTISPATRAVRAPAQARRSPPTWPRSVLARTPAVPSACRQASTTSSVCA